MNIKRVKYKMSSDDSWNVGYIIGSYDGQNETLIDDKFKYIPRVSHEGKEYLAYDIKDDIEKRLNITLTM